MTPAPAATAQKPMTPLEAGPFGDRMNLSRDWMLHRPEKHEDRSAPASPELDDAGWDRIDTGKNLVQQGIWGANELWYRTHVHITPGSHDIALTLSDIGGSYRVYVNGVELGGHGTMSGRGDYLIARSATFRIPDALIASGNITVAIHAFVGTVDRTTATMQDGISPHSKIYLGTATVLERDEAAYFAAGRASRGSLLTLWFVLLVLAGALAVMVRKVPLYALLAAVAAGKIVSGLLIDYSGTHYLSRTQWLTWPINLAMLVSTLAALEFARVAAGVRRRLWIKLLEGFYTLATLLLVPAALGAVSYWWYSGAAIAANTLVFLAVFVLLLLGAARRRRDAMILLGGCGALVLTIGLWGMVRHAHPALPLAAEAAAWVGENLGPRTLTELVAILCLFTLLVVHTVGIVRERATISGEIEAARTMQQLLLARSSDATPGFAVETAYLPAGELGGDFFLVSPTQDGSLGAVIGDVSGKGLLAAMRVSMILGVLRREPSRAPATVLCSLNEALLAQSEMGFTTACAVELHPDGSFVIANAGHLAPYVANGLRSVELATVPMLPLGLMKGQSYELYEGRLAPGDRLVLLSDGVPEARSRRGELYGFDRTGPLTLRPASEIAATALAFGQEDDITVVTLACLAGTGSPNTPPHRTPPPPPRAVPPPPFVTQG